MGYPGDEWPASDPTHSGETASLAAVRIAHGRLWRWLQARDRIGTSTSSTASSCLTRRSTRMISARFSSPCLSGSAWFFAAARPTTIAVGLCLRRTWVSLYPYRSLSVGKPVSKLRPSRLLRHWLRWACTTLSRGGLVALGLHVTKQPPSRFCRPVCWWFCSSGPCLVATRLFNERRASLFFTSSSVPAGFARALALGLRVGFEAKNLKRQRARFRRSSYASSYGAM